MPGVVAHCLPASKLQAKAGAVRGSKKADVGGIGRRAFIQWGPIRKLEVQLHGPCSWRQASCLGFS